MHSLRLFAAIRPPEDSLDQLIDLQTHIEGARWSAREKLHLTLGFFGDVTVESAELLDESLGAIHMAGFDVQLKGTGHFGRAEPISLWAGVVPSASLSQLNKACLSAARRCGLKPENRKYTPHITLAYLKPSVSPSRIMAFEQTHARFEPEPFLVDRFYLYSSWRRPGQPNEYTIEACYPLLGR